MRIPILVAGLALMGAAGAPPAPVPLDWEAMAGRIVRQMALVPGERVLLVAHPGEFAEIVAPLRRAVARAGGVDLGCWLVLPSPAGAEPGVAPGAAAAQKALGALTKEVDVAVMLPGATPEHPEYAAMQDALRAGHGRTVHFHWQGGGAASAVALPGRPLPPAATIDAVYQHALLATDYPAVAAAERRFAAALRDGEVHLTSPAGTDLRFRAGDRPANLQDGDASAARAAAACTLVDREIELPCGAVRVAPLEETVEGTIAFPPGQWAGREVTGLRLRFARGKVVAVTAATGQEAAEEELGHGGDAARSFREFALGFNPELAVPAAAPWIPYYGYGAGVVRLSLGDNGELGGKVRGDYVRWNFFTDTTVAVDGRVWVQGGRLVGP
jgi:aminopeptidase